MRSVTRPATATSPTSARDSRAARAPALVTVIDARQATERRVVATLLAAVLGLIIAVGVSAARSSVVTSRAEARISGSLGRASLAQMEFRTRYRRFGLWEELAADGASLPAELSVVTSTASRSHWYLRVRDRESGVTCDRVGQLLDPPGAAVIPNCESPR